MKSTKASAQPELTPCTVGIVSRTTGSEKNGAHFTKPGTALFALPSCLECRARASCHTSLVTLSNALYRDHFLIRTGEVAANAFGRLLRLGSDDEWSLRFASIHKSLKFQPTIEQRSEEGSKVFDSFGMFLSWRVRLPASCPSNSTPDPSGLRVCKDFER